MFFQHTLRLQKKIFIGYLRQTKYRNISQKCEGWKRNFFKKII